MPITLHPMTPDDHAAWAPRIAADAAHSRTRAEGLTEAEAAAALAQPAFVRPPPGLDRPGHHFMRLHDADTDTRVGAAWCHITPEAAFAFVYYVEIDPEHRGNGHGRAAMTALMDFARAQGCRQLALQVWSHNTPAVNLYDSLGFATFGRAMRVALDAPPDDDPASP